MIGTAVDWAIAHYNENKRAEWAERHTALHAFRPLRWWGIAVALVQWRRARLMIAARNPQLLVKDRNRALEEEGRSENEVRDRSQVARKGFPEASIARSSGVPTSENERGAAQATGSEAMDTMRPPLFASHHRTEPRSRHSQLELE